jgi:AcrR family transcriptional regulator
MCSYPAPSRIAGSPANGQPTERILRAAIACYTQYGVSRTTTAEIARVAGVSRGTVYRYFPGPKALHRAAVNLMARDVQLQVEAAADPCHTFSEFVVTLFEVLAAQLVTIRARQHLLEEQETLSHAMYHTDDEETRQFITRLLRTPLGAARARGELDADVCDIDIAETVWIAVRAMTKMRSSPVVDLDDPVAVGRWFSRLVVRGVGAH